MAIRFGQFLHIGSNDFLIERLQTVGPDALNIPTERIREVGNYQSVATIRDTPDLSFAINSYSATVELEEYLLGETLDADDGNDLKTIKPVSILTQLKPGESAAKPFNIAGSVVFPSLLAERVSYRFATGENSTIDVTLRGDSVYYNPGPAYVETAAGSGVAKQDVVLTNVAGAYVSSAGTVYALAVLVDGQRLIYGVDYTEAATGAGDYKAVTVTVTDAVEATSTIEVIYFSNVELEDLDQDIHTADDVTNPAALRGKNVEIYVGGYDPDDIPGSQTYRWSGVRTATAEWSQTIESDTELGSAYARERSASDVPSVTGTLTIRPLDVTEFFTRLQAITGVAADQAIGPESADPISIDIVLKDSTGATLKRLNIPDARLSIPGYSAQVGQKQDFDLTFESDGGQLLVFPA